MAKKQDPFEKFREATLGEDRSLSGALNSKAEDKTEEVRKEEKAEKPAAAKKDRKLVSFYLDGELFRKLGVLKFEEGTKYEDLYNEAVRDLLVKYNRI